MRPNEGAGRAAQRAPASRVGAVHVHTSYSHDGRDTPAALREFARRRGIAFVALTDHAEDLDPPAFERLVADCRAASDAEVTILPGLEFRFEGYPGLHLLAMGLTRWIAPASPAEFIRLAGPACGLTMVAHPLLCDYVVPPEVAAGIDAVEVWNAAYNTRFLPDPRAIRLLERIRRTRPEVVGLAGLDQHDARNDRETRVVVTDRAARDPLAALKEGRFVNLGRTMTFAAQDAFGPARLAALTALRAGLDAVNAIHERVSYAMRGRR